MFASLTVIQFLTNAKGAIDSFSAYYKLLIFNPEIDPKVKRGNTKASSVFLAPKWLLNALNILVAVPAKVLLTVQHPRYRW